MPTPASPSSRSATTIWRPSFSPAAGSSAQGPAKIRKPSLFTVIRSVYGKNTDAHLLRSLLRLLIQQLRSEGIEPVAYWYNPNIHPYQEYKARRDTLMAYAPTIGMELIVQENYGLREFCRAVCGISTTAAACAMPCGWPKRPNMPPGTAMTASPPPCW